MNKKMHKCINPIAILNIPILFGKAQPIIFYISKLTDQVNSFDVPLNVYSSATFMKLFCVRYKFLTLKS